jgi:periplasmic divalent cation tolerance protein
MVRSKLSYPVMRKGGIWQLIGMTEELVIIFSTASESEAPPIAQALVMQHLAACVNILPVISVYRWQGDLCRDREHLLIIKTVQKNVETVIREIRKLHSTNSRRWWSFLLRVDTSPTWNGWPRRPVHEDRQPSRDPGQG